MALCYQRFLPCCHCQLARWSNLVIRGEVNVWLIARSFGIGLVLGCIAAFLGIRLNFIYLADTFLEIINEGRVVRIFKKSSDSSKFCYLYIHNQDFFSLIPF